LIISAQQTEILKLYIPNIEKILATNDVQSVLDAVDDLILNNILGNNDEPDNEGIMLQKIYDNIFAQN
jgi:hypothetical protein